MAKKPRLALARVNYSQLYKVYDDGKTYKHRDVLIPYHLTTLAGHVLNRDVDVKIFDGECDLLFQKELAQQIVDWEPDFVGLTATTPDIVYTLEVCQYIKEMNPKIKTIIGGPHPSAMPDELTKLPYIDYVVVGDGEYPLDLIIDKETGGGISDKIEDGFDNDQYFKEQRDSLRTDPSKKTVMGRVKSLLNEPRPAHHILDYTKYQFTDPSRGRSIAASVMSSRGCPFSCTFCFHDRKVRQRDEDSFISEIEFLVNEKDVRYFYVYDDTFTIHRKRAMRLLDRIKNLNLKDVHFQCLTRANLLDPEIMDKLADAGFVRVSMGVESGSEDILKHVSKEVKKEDYLNAMDMITAAGMETRGSFILGHPHDTKETIRETIDFSKALELYHCNFNILTPYPGTYTYTQALKGDGIRFRNPEDAKDWEKYKRWGIAIVETENVSGQELEDFQKSAQTEFYTQDKIFKYYENRFKSGNTSRYFYRPFNYAWKRKYGKDIPFWDKLDQTEVIAAD